MIFINNDLAFISNDSIGGRTAAVQSNVNGENKIASCHRPAYCLPDPLRRSNAERSVLSGGVGSFKANHFAFLPSQPLTQDGICPSLCSSGIRLLIVGYSRIPLPSGIAGDYRKDTRLFPMTAASAAIFSFQRTFMQRIIIPTY